MESKKLTANQRHAFRRCLVNWYEREQRRLPWRETKDPYRVWLSEIMLQQTRVAAVIPYYENFLRRFPSVEALARAPERDLLVAWSGLGYYSRARNLRKAARQIVASGTFPSDYAGLRALAGVGDYTAAALASLVYDLPYAVLDGNVLRVLCRIGNDAGDTRASVTRKRLVAVAQDLLDKKCPGLFNQAMMELGAIVCLPRKARCEVCPVARYCEARQRGTQHELPVKLRKADTVKVETTLLIIERNGRLLLRQRPPEAAKLAGFWELPESHEIPSAAVSARIGQFPHAITNHNYRISVIRATIGKAPAGFRWVNRGALSELPLTTTARKAISLSQG